MMLGPKSLFKEKAQTAMELAVFGAIVIFMLGTIVRQGLSAGYNQNQALKAVRLAMTESYKHSEGLEGTCMALGGDPDDCSKGDASRNSASITIIEDRLTANSGKYGAIDRVPLISAGSATNSRNLFMPVEADEPWNLPMVDFFVNGQHIPLLTAKLKTVTFPNCTISNTNPGPLDKMCEPNCMAGSSPIGCYRLYTMIPNHPDFPWCTDNCPVISADARFDLDHSGTMDSPDPDVPGTETPQIPREKFSWQWYLIFAVDVNAKGSGSINNGGEGVNVKDSKNISVDVDNDLKEERIMKVISADGAGVIRQAQVMDLQDGDLDTTWSKTDKDAKPQPGLLKDVQMFTLLNDGTYLQIDEGKLYGPGKQFIRTASKKNQVDIIQRVLQLSNDTGRFCKDGQPLPPGDGRNGSEWDPANGYPNPVEACAVSGSDCFSNGKMGKTCFVPGSPGQPPVIFIRSRIEEKSGRKWITDESADRNVDFQR